jgi:putative nucleotidyltransferase with HDIG domain
MSFSSPRRHRPSRATSLNLPPNFFARAYEVVRRPEVLFRVAAFILATLILWLVTGAGTPPFAFRRGDVPKRKIIARVDFQRLDEAETDKRRQEARLTAEAVYENNPRLLEEKRQELTNKVANLVQAETFDAVLADEKLKTEWLELSPPAMNRPEDAEPERFESLKTYFTSGMDQNRFDESIKRALAPFEKNGLLKDLKHKPDQGSQVKILVYPTGNKRQTHEVAVDEVRIDRAKTALRQRLEAELRFQGRMVENAGVVADLAYTWLESRLPETLNYDQAASSDEAARAEAAVQPVQIEYKAGIAELAPGGKPIGDLEISLLRDEYDAWVEKLGPRDILSRSFATLGMYLAMAVLCGFYIYHRRPKLLADFRSYATLLAALVAAVVFGWFFSEDNFRAEIIPLLLFGMTAAIAYEKELALLLSAAIALILSFALDQGLAQFVILVSSVAAAILLLRRIRSRTKLMYVGAFTGLVVMLTTIGVGTLVGQAYGPTSPFLSWSRQHLAYHDTFYVTLALGALWLGICSLLAGVLMTGLLPFVERIFDVQTDISLLELGDVQHPLLQELVRRAPGTYNHSINVASIAETAADAIGANGLLVRVGAYFHDIGKMLKPSYFVENQGSEASRHESLQPAMSTLVIIAHVKDGADLARQHRLPQSIIDFIEQHHGTTLVEYFYRREAQRLKDDPDAGDLDETTFRYPGPKPQSKEAGVLMLADVVESASRALVDPTPARIESLVHDLAMKRLLDGQYDECGLTLSELHTIEDSLVKSLTAVYHGRVKYPEHQTV